MKITISALFLLVLVVGVRAQGKYLLLSNGGGVAGTAVVYKIQDDGKVYRGKGLGDIKFDEASKLRKCRTKKFFKKTRSLLADHPEFNHPGNMYSSLSLYENGSERKLSWGDAAFTTPEDAKKLYQKMNARISKLTFASELRK